MMKVLQSTFIFLLLLVFAAPALAQVYLTKEQALNLVLGSGTKHRYDPKLIDDRLTEELDSGSLLGEVSRTAHFFIGTKDDKVTGYALIDNEVGKHLPITYIVGISPEGKVTRVEMMVFREVRGWEARERNFLKQFDEKASGEDLRVGSAIRHVSGATLSSKAMAKGVGRALFLWEHFYGSTAGAAIAAESTN